MRCDTNECNQIQYSILAYNRNNIYTINLIIFWHVIFGFSCHKVASWGNTNVCLSLSFSFSLPPISRNISISAKSTRIFMKLLSTLSDLTNMAPLGHGEYPNFQDLPISLPNQLGFLWNLKLMLLGLPTNHPKLSTLGYLPQMAPLGLGIWGISQF